MKHLIRLRPSPAMVVACLALGIALGGTSYAAIKLPRNSVGTKQLKKNAVTSPKVKNNAITGADVLESSLGQVPSAASATNATNATHATTANTAAPSGAAGGDLTGTFPNPTVGAGKITPAKFGVIPQARVEMATDQSITGDATITPLTWGTATYNTAGMFNVATPDRLTAPIAGVYAIDGGVRWAANVNGFRFAAVCLNGPSAGGCTATTDVAVSEYPTNDSTMRLTQQTVSTQLKLAAGDVVQLAAAQDSGVALLVNALPATNFEMTWIGSG
jgi:hypothetical protein